MEVTKSNLNDFLPEIKTSIENASFISIDAEYTGLNTSSDNDYSLFDSLETRYKKLKTVTSNFVISQFGLTVFTKCEKDNKYLVKTYTFYLCPHQCGSNDRRFMWQASCAQFLAHHSFDFNKFVYEGIPYLNEVGEEQARLEISRNNFCNHHFRNLNKRGLDDKLIELTTKGKVGDDVIVKQDLVDHEFFQLKYLRLMYPETWSVLENNQVIVQKISSEQRKELEKTEAEEEEKVLEFYIGFSHVFKALIKAKKPLVGHNMLMDIFLMYNSFYKPLPRTLKEFKENFSAIFPIVYDTKHIWCNMKKYYKIQNVPRESELHYLYSLFQEPPDEFVTLFSPVIEHTNGEIYCQQDLRHNAGFDSYVTGFVFLKLCHVFAMNKTKSLVQIVPQTFKQHMRAVEPFKNKVNIARARVHFIDFGGADSNNQRPELLYVKLKNGKQPFDAEMVLQKITYYGFVEIQQISHREAVIAVASFGSARDILSEFQKDKELLIMPYSYIHHYMLPKCAFWSVCLGISCIGSYTLYRILR